MNRNTFRAAMGLSTTTIALAAAIMLAPSKAAHASPAKMACNNMACWGANTCERHTGTNCDLANPSVPDGCVTTSCTS